MGRSVSASVVILAGLVLGCEAPDPQLVAAGRAVYEARGCGSCHGARGQGTSMAPPLAGVSRRFGRGELAEFLADPAPVIARDARLSALDRKYPADMPGAPGATREELSALVEYVRQLKP